MKMKVLLSIAVLTAATFAFTACSDDKDDNKEGNELEAKESFLATTNKDMVNKTILPIYTNLMNANKQLVEAIGKMETQADVNKACDLWKIARKSWEQSESFLYGPATDFGIDPHTAFTVFHPLVGGHISVIFQVVLVSFVFKPLRPQDHSFGIDPHPAFAVFYPLVGGHISVIFQVDPFVSGLYPLGCYHLAVAVVGPAIVILLPSGFFSRFFF